jgi:vancomycin resistance protein VanW
MIRKWIPAQIKRKIRLFQRNRSDRQLGYHKRFAKPNHKSATYPEYQVCEIHQPIFYNPLSANKVENIRIAISMIEKVEIEPNQIFSFWSIIGEPLLKKGYKTGRNIIGDRLQEDIGGGLCQVSGMLYHLALIAGLEILERHSHTLDLYEEDKRYTPLGADATVVFGYKDIRFINNSNSLITFRFEVSQTDFTGYLLASEKLPLRTLKFERKEFEDYRTIDTFRTTDGEDEYINHSKYILPKK